MDDLYIQDLLHPDDSEDTDSDDSAPEQEADIIEQKIEEEHIETAIKLDYKIKTCEERASLVTRIIEATPPEQLSARYLEILGDYIMGALSKEDKKAHLYITDNRLITINKRETSFEGLADKFENGEDGIYNLMINDKNVLFAPKISITDADVETVPGLKELRANMAVIEEAGKNAVGRRKYLLKKQLIEMRRDQYVLKNSYKAPLFFTMSPRGSGKIDLSENRYVDSQGEPQSTGLITLFNPEHILAIMRNYNALKLETAGKYWSDFFYLLEDFDKLLHRALDPYPAYYDLVQYKIEGKSNTEIQEMLKERHGLNHTVQHISALWCHKIPKLMAEKEQNDFLIWYYSTQEEGKWKRCSCCGEVKLAHNRFFSKNKTAKDGWYSQCKECRNKKTGQK